MRSPEGSVTRGRTASQAGSQGTAGGRSPSGCGGTATGLGGRTGLNHCDMGRRQGTAFLDWVEFEGNWSLSKITYGPGQKFIKFSTEYICSQLF